MKNETPSLQKRVRQMSQGANKYPDSIDKFYYAHSMEFYDSQQEKSDLKHFTAKMPNVMIVNPKTLGLGNSMSEYLKVVQTCDEVWFRGTTIGVNLEILTALAMGKPVFSMITKKPISDSVKTYFISNFNKSFYRDHDLREIQTLFGKAVHKRFLKLIEGDLQ